MVKQNLIKKSDVCHSIFSNAKYVKKKYVLIEQLNI